MIQDPALPPLGELPTLEDDYDLGIDPGRELALRSLGAAALKPERKLTLADFGFRQLTDDDIDAGYGALEVARGFSEEIQPEAEDIPLLGMGFSLDKMIDVVAAGARMKRGKATLEDEREVFRWMVNEARTKTRGGSFADILKQFGTSGIEILGGAGLVKVGSVAARKGLQLAIRESLAESAEKAVQRKAEQISGELMLETGIDASMGSAVKEAGKVVGKGAATLGTTFGLQEAVPRVTGFEGGAWSAQAVRSIFGEDLTDEEIDQIVAAKDAALPVMLAKGGGLIEGAIRQAIQVGTEGLGFGLAQLPPFQQVDYIMAGLFSRLSGRAAKVGWLEAAREAAMFAGPGGEIAEEYAADVLTASVFGDKSIVEAVADVTEVLPELLAASSVPGAAGAVIGRATGKLGDMMRPESPEAQAAEGGDAGAAAPEVGQAEGAAVSEGLAPEVRAADVEALRADVKRATGLDVDFRAVEGDLRSEEVAAQKFLRRVANVEMHWAEAPEGTDLEALPAAFYPGEGRAIGIRGQPGVMGAAVHEGLHTYLAQQPAERRADLGNALREIDPVFMGRVEAFVRAQPLYQNVSPDVLAEELTTNAATLLGGLTSYLDTPQGRKDFALAYGKQPGPIRQVLGALYDWVAERIRLLPQRQRALARARLRVARNEGDPALVAQRVLEALREIRPVRAESSTDRLGIVSESSRETMPAAQEPVSPQESPPQTAGGSNVAPRPAKTPQDRRANRAAKRARAAARAEQFAAEQQAKKAADDRRQARALRQGRPRIVEDTDEQQDGSDLGLGPDQGMRFAARPPIDVDGVQRPRVNSEGRPIHGTDEGLRAFWRWFGDSGVVDEQGRPLVVYHGAKRPDRIGSKFDPKRARSGPMAFYTTDPSIASSYAQSKSDTSIDVPEDYAEWFTYKPKGARSAVRIDQAWSRMSDEERARVRERFSRVTVLDDAGETVPVALLPEGETAVGGADHWQEVMRYKAQGNPLRAMVDVWLNSATLFGQEEQFIDLLRAAGVDADRLSFESPQRENPGVIPVVLKIRNPFDTSKIDAPMIERLRQASKRKRGSEGEGVDYWDKRHVSGAEFMRRLEQDLANGTSHTWTSIPDWVTDVLKASGFDGIRDDGGKLSGNKHDVWVPFRANQIKSATGNRGTFDPASDDIRFAPRPPADALVASFLDDAEILDLSSRALRAVSDEFLAVERWQKAAKALGATTGSNPISAIRRFFGKVAVKAEPIKDFANRIGDHLRKSGIALPDAGLYAEARHTREAREDFLRKHKERKRLAEERKALVKAAKAVPRDAQFERDLKTLEKRIADLDFVPIVIPDGHTAEHYFHEVADVTGMKTSEAEAKLAEFEAQPGYKRLGRMIDALNRWTLRQHRDYQLITQQQYDSRSAQFEHYVPLRTAEVDRPERPRGSGFNVRGPETMRRKGRRSLASNPLVMSMAQAMKAVERGEKNAVGHELRDFLQENKGVIGSAERDVALNDEGKPALDSDEFYLKVDGRDVAIKIENKDVARAMKRLGLPQIPKALRLYGALFGYWKLAATSLSPEFLLTNFARDVETALVNVSSVAKDLDLKGLRRDMVKGIPAAGRTAWQAARENPITTGLGDYFEEYRQAGGQIGSFGSAAFEAIEQNMESRMSTTPAGKARRALAPLWSAIEDANGAVEQANRFSLFVTLRQRGVSVNDAALAARKITVDFSQKGEFGTALSLIYAFFSAAVGGTRRLAETMNSPVGRRIAGGLVGFGFARTLANYYSSDDDDDGRKFYEKISEGEKERSAVFMVPGFNEPIKIPLGYGLNVFDAAGRIMAETVLGMHSEGEAAELMLLTALNGFAPIGSAPSLLQFVSPTVADPFVQVAENKNFMGSPVTPYASPFGAEEPKYKKSFRTTSPLAIDMARVLNDMTGGDSIKPGALNVSGDEIEHFYEFAGAGVARFVKRAFDASRAIASGESFSDVAQVAPFLRVVYGARTEFADSDTFYEAMDSIEYSKRYIKEAEDAGDRERVRELRDRFRATMALEKQGKRVKEQAKVLRDEAYTAGKLTNPEKLREANRLMQNWTRQYFEALSGADNGS